LFYRSGAQWQGTQALHNFYHLWILKILFIIMSKEETFDRQKVKERLKEAKLNIRSDQYEGEYKFDNEDLE
jgi:hypothetical protein